MADRFHVIRLVNHHFLACWRGIDPVASRNHALVSLMRRQRERLRPEQQANLDQHLETQPLPRLIYRFKQRLCFLLLHKNRTRKQCARLALPFIATMWRFSRNNGIAEGFHNKMEIISRQAYGFRNFENYRMRVKVLCG